MSRKAFVEGQKLRSQHSIFGPVKRVAGPAGNAPRWADSLRRSWDRYELKDLIRREKSKQYVDERTGQPLPQVGKPQLLGKAAA